MSDVNWLSNLYSDRWSPELEKLHTETLKFNEYGQDPIWGKDTTWYFWDETWADACGPYESRDEAVKALELYVKHL